MPIRVAIIVSHPIQHFAPWHRELARVPDIDVKVFFCCDLGLTSYVDLQFKTEFKWDLPLIDGYSHEFLPIRRRPQSSGFWEIDNPSVGAALDRFNPDVVKIFGYAHRTSWRVARWARRNSRPLLLYSDSNAQVVPAWWKRAIKDGIVHHFYKAYVDGALFVGDNNCSYHRRYGVASDRLFPGVLPIDRGMLLKTVPDAAVTRKEVRNSLGIPDDAFVVLFCGKYIARKRPRDLVVAVRELARKGLPMWALLVGEGEERVVIETLCRTEDVQNISLTGFVNQSTIARHFAAADLLAVTSEADPHPLVVSEAACFGLPVVISDRVGCVGSNDSAQPERNALVFPCGDVQQLANAIERLWRDRELYHRMSDASFQIAQSQDVGTAVEQLAFAVRSLHKLGPRRLAHFQTTLTPVAVGNAPTHREG
jgi:glycosyltransferase involved in cell wall biosynthesis